jgi:hypothetical protein
MELEGSLPCSQELSTGPHSEPDQFISVVWFDEWDQERGGTWGFYWIVDTEREIVLKNGIE